MEQPTNKSQFARLAGVSRPAILKACKPGNSLHEAVLDSGRIDLAHPAARAYVQKHGGILPASEKGAEPEQKATEPESSAEPDPEPKQKTPRNKRGGYAKRRNEIESAPVPEVSDEPPSDDTDVPEKIAPFADMTLRQLIQRFGTETAFKDWLQALKQIEDIREKRVKNARVEGELIPRDLVEHHILGAFEAAHINLLTDGSQTIASRAASMVHAGADEQEVQAFVEGTISKMLKAAKTKATRALKNA